MSVSPDQSCDKCCHEKVCSHRDVYVDLIKRNEIKAIDYITKAGTTRNTGNVDWLGITLRCIFFDTAKPEAVMRGGPGGCPTNYDDPLCD